MANLKYNYTMYVYMSVCVHVCVYVCMYVFYTCELRQYDIILAVLIENLIF